jgi:hypothetical protein
MFNCTLGFVKQWKSFLSFALRSLCYKNLLPDPEIRHVKAGVGLHRLAHKMSMRFRGNRIPNIEVVATHFTGCNNQNIYFID